MSIENTDAVILPTDFTEVEPQTVAEKQASYRALKDHELVEYMRSIGLKPAYNEDGKLMRKECMSQLRDNDERMAAEEKRKRKVRVVFHSASNNSAGNYVYASVNDRNFQAPYEKEVIIPEYMLTECIDRARTKETRPVQVQNPDGSQVTKKETKYYPMYPYTVLGYVD